MAALKEGAPAKLVFLDSGREKVILGSFLWEDSETIAIKAKDTGLEVRVGRSALVWMKELDSLR